MKAVAKALKSTQLEEADDAEEDVGHDSIMDTTIGDDEDDDEEVDDLL